MSLHTPRLGFLVCFRARADHGIWTAHVLGGTALAPNTL